MYCAASRIANVAVIHLNGRWDAFSAPEFEQFWKKLAREQNPLQVVLDLKGVDYVSSFGLRGLLDLGKRLEKQGGGMHVAGMCSTVRKVFLGSGLSSLFPVFEDAESAAAAFSRMA